MSVFDKFERKHDYLVCVDSDGCAMNTMNCKHFHCFGPCVVMEWGLDEWRVAVLERWNDINLFRMTRGINRFQGLAIVLSEINERYTPIVGLEALAAWVKNTDIPSNETLMDAILAAPEGDGKVCLEKALSWSKTVNATIAQLPGELKTPYEGAAETLAVIADFADVAVVSNANSRVVAEEWGLHGLLEYADILLTQERGSKAHCISEMLKFGYQKDRVLMIGDAPDDCEAAEANGIWYYPILVNKEVESWNELREVGLDTLCSGQYTDYQLEKKRQFFANLGG